MSVPSVQSDPPQSSVSGTLVQIEHLSKLYQEGEMQRTVLDRVNLTFAVGEFVVLLGHSGSGHNPSLAIVHPDAIEKV